MSRLDLDAVLRTLGACAASIAWSVPYGTDWERALAACTDRRWLTWLACALMRRGHLRREVIVLCACACARTALQHVPAGEERPLRAIGTAERWARGAATLDEVRAAAAAAYAAAAAAYDDAAAYDAAAAAAYAAAAAAAYDDAAAYDAVARDRAEVELRAVTRRELGAALLGGLSAYAATLPAAQGEVRL